MSKWLMRWHWDGFMIGLGILYVVGAVGAAICRMLAWWLDRKR